MPTSADDDLKVHKGAPPKSNDNKTMSLFGGLAIIVVVVILLFSNVVVSIDQGFDTAAARALSSLLMATVVSVVQMWLFRHSIRSDNRILFVGAGALGGAVGGWVSASLGSSYGTAGALQVGALIGVLAGAISSVAQTGLMRQKAMATNWVVFSVLSWTAIWSAGYVASWSMGGVPGVALSGGVIMAASGLALWLYLQNAHIEF